MLALALAAALAGLLPAAVSAAPAAPTGLSAAVRDGRYVQLSWRRSAGDDGTFRYRVVRNGIQIGALSLALSYLDRPAIGRQVYQVRAVDGVGNLGALSASVTVWAVSRVAGASTPAKPVNLAGTTGSLGQARLTWNAGTGGTSPTAAYRIYRDGLLVATVTTRSFDDFRAGRLANSYNYAVQAVDADGYGSGLTPTVRVAVEPSHFRWAGVQYFNKPLTVPSVALTFDDCNNGRNVARIAAILREHDAAGTFFCTGEATVKNVDVLTAVARDFPVGNHTWDHADLTYLSSSATITQLNRATKKIEAATGRPLPGIMRPPYGATNSTVRANMKRLGLAVVRWNIDTNDWRQSATSTSVLNAALAADNGDIVLMHDKAKTVEALPQIISGLRANGYRLVTITDMLDIPWSPAERDDTTATSSMGFEVDGRTAADVAPGRWMPTSR